MLFQHRQYRFGRAIPFSFANTSTRDLMSGGTRKAMSGSLPVGFRPGFFFSEGITFFPARFVMHRESHADGFASLLILREEITRKQLKVYKNPKWFYTCSDFRLTQFIREMTTCPSASLRFKNIPCYFHCSQGIRDHDTSFDNRGALVLV